MTDVGAARAAMGAAVERLTTARARDEILAELRPARRIGPIRRPPVLTAIGRVWRLGVLLLSPDGQLYALGSVTRAVDPRHPNFQSLSGEERREIRAAAMKAGFPIGVAVDYDAVPIDVATGGGAVIVDRGVVKVSWNGSRDPAAWTDFAGYLHERVELLADPPPGA